MCDNSPIVTLRQKASRELEGRSFTTSVLYWVGVLEQATNVAFARAMKARKSIVPRWRTLSILAERSGLTISELARQTFIERTALSRLLALMERERLLERRPRPGDKRTIEVRITAMGRRAFERMLPVRRAVFKHAARGVRKADVEKLMTLVQHLVENLHTSPRRRAAARRRK